MQYASEAKQATVGIIVLNFNRDFYFILFIYILRFGSLRSTFSPDIPSRDSRSDWFKKIHRILFTLDFRSRIFTFRLQRNPVRTVQLVEFQSSDGCSSLSLETIPI